MISCHERTAPAERPTNRCPPSRGKPCISEMGVLHWRVSNARRRWHDHYSLRYETEKTQQRQAAAELHGVFSLRLEKYHYLKIILQVFLRFSFAAPSTPRYGTQYFTAVLHDKQVLWNTRIFVILTRVPSEGQWPFHHYSRFAGLHPGTAGMSLSHSCGPTINRQGITLPTSSMEFFS